MIVVSCVGAFALVATTPLGTVALFINWVSLDDTETGGWGQVRVKMPSKMMSELVLNSSSLAILVEQSISLEFRLLVPDSTIELASSFDSFTKSMLSFDPVNVLKTDC